MKKLVWLLCTLSMSSFAYQHEHSSPTDNWAEDSLDRYQTKEAFIPISIVNAGDGIPYYIEVNNRQVTDIFVLDDGESVNIEVPVTMEDHHGGQHFNVCSVSSVGMSGARVCSNVELFNLYPSELLK